MLLYKQVIERTYILALHWLIIIPGDWRVTFDSANYGVWSLHFWPVLQMSNFPTYLISVHGRFND